MLARKKKYSNSISINDLVVDEIIILYLSDHKML